MTAAPCAGTLTLVTDRLSLSRSVSLVRTAIVVAVSSAVVAASSTAPGHR